MAIKIEREQKIEGLKKLLQPVLTRHQVLRAGIFGSVARGTSIESSDVDLLVEFQGEKNLLDLVALKLDLESVVNREIDVVTYNSLSPLIRKNVLAQEVRVL